MENDDYDLAVQIICSDKNSLHLAKCYLFRLSEFSQQLSSNIEQQLSKNVNNNALILDFCDVEELAIFAEIFLTSKNYAHEILLAVNEFYDEAALQTALNLSSKFNSDQLLIACADYALRFLKFSPFNFGKMPIYVDLLSNLKHRNMDSIFRRFYATLYSEFCIWLSSYDFDRFSDNNSILLSKNFQQIHLLKYRALEFCTKIQNRFCHDYCRMQYACKFDPFCQSSGLKCVKCDDFVCRLCGNSQREAETNNTENDVKTCKKCLKSFFDCSCIKYGTIACEFCTICQENFLFCRCDEPKIDDDDEDFWSFVASFLIEN